MGFGLFPEKGKENIEVSNDRARRRKTRIEPIVSRRGAMCDYNKILARHKEPSDVQSPRNLLTERRSQETESMEASARLDNYSKITHRSLSGPKRRQQLPTKARKRSGSREGERAAALAI